ncbi:MAG: hypothetical protein N3F65_03775 [Nitrososphaeria archaeon]|nr:hypothetical protein [Nitrososphaeria archaeon]MDW8021166.1 hypothetical protein [Nitrososphaerota archaeon]
MSEVPDLMPQYKENSQELILAGAFFKNFIYSPPPYKTSTPEVEQMPQIPHGDAAAFFGLWSFSFRYYFALA